MAVFYRSPNAFGDVCKRLRPSIFRSGDRLVGPYEQIEKLRDKILGTLGGGTNKYRKELLNTFESGTVQERRLDSFLSGRQDFGFEMVSQGWLLFLHLCNDMHRRAEVVQVLYRHV